MITRFEGMAEDNPDVRLRSRAGFGGARSRIHLPNRTLTEEVGEHVEGGDGGAVDGHSQQVVNEEQRQNIIDRDKYMLVVVAVVAFNIVWFLGGWLLANILFLVGLIHFLSSIRSV